MKTFTNRNEEELSKYQISKDAQQLMKHHMNAMQSAYNECLKEVLLRCLGREPELPKDAERFSLVRSPHMYLRWGWEDGIKFDGKLIGTLRAEFIGHTWRVTFTPEK